MWHESGCLWWKVNENQRSWWRHQTGRVWNHLASMREWAAGEDVGGKTTTTVITKVIRSRLSGKQADVRLRVCPDYMNTCTDVCAWDGATPLHTITPALDVQTARLTSRRALAAVCTAGWSCLQTINAFMAEKQDFTQQTWELNTEHDFIVNIFIWW